MILVAGGTGTLGQRLVPMLRARGTSVRVLARHARAADKATSGAPIETVAGDIRDAVALRAALEGVETVVSAITGFGGQDALGSRKVDRDGNLALIAAARDARVDHFVLLSVHQAGPTHPIELFRDKWAAEEALRASGLTWTIVRPTAYLETWLGLIGGPLVATGRTRIFGSGSNPINFVSATDVARLVDLSAADDRMRQAVVEAPGPANLTFDQLAVAVESVIGRTGVKRHVSPVMMRMAAAVTRVVDPVLSAQIRTALVMNERDMTVDLTAVRAPYSSMPATTAADVAAELFGSGHHARRDHLTRIEAPQSSARSR
jgi:uncharacterized protein YbjT (DUF2867 family)